MVCRWGGDEIVIGLFGANEEEAAEIAEKIRFSVEEGTKNESHRGYFEHRSGSL